MKIKNRFIKALKMVLCFLLFMVFFMSTVESAEDVTSGRDIAQRVYDRNNGDDFIKKAIMELKDKRGRKRIRDFITYSKDYGSLSNNLIRFTSPKDIKGTGFLSIEKAPGKTTQYLYLPALRRSRRIVSTQKSQRFVNSDYTYEDMERNAVDDYEYKILGEETLRGYPCYLLESKPKKGVTSQYSKLISKIVKESYMPIFVEYFNKKNRLIKRYNVLKIETIQSIPTEMVSVMEDLKKKHETRLITESCKYNSGVQNRVFSKKNLDNY